MQKRKRNKTGPKRIPVRDLENEESGETASPHLPDEPVEREAEVAESVEEPPMSETEEEKAEPRDLAEELAAMTGNWQRERASFMNYKRRVEEEKRLIRKYAYWDLAEDLLRVLDYFESSISFEENLPEEANSVLVGVKYTIDELTRVLAAHGVRPIDIETGQSFDSSCMEGVERLERDDAAANGTVLEVRRRGWRLHDRVLRSAQVVVEVAPDDETDKAAGEGGEQKDGRPEENPESESRGNGDGQ